MPDREELLRAELVSRARSLVRPTPPSDFNQDCACAKCNFVRVALELDALLTAKERGDAAA